MNCQFRWQAPYLHPNGAKSWHPQSCILPKDHEGPHRSANECIYPNTRQTKSTNRCLLPDLWNVFKGTQPHTNTPPTTA